MVSALSFHLHCSCWHWTIYSVYNWYVLVYIEDNESIEGWWKDSVSLRASNSILLGRWTAAAASSLHLRCLDYHLPWNWTGACCGSPHHHVTREGVHQPPGASASKVSRPIASCSWVGRWKNERPIDNQTQNLVCTWCCVRPRPTEAYILSYYLVLSCRPIYEAPFCIGLHRPTLDQLNRLLSNNASLTMS